MNPDNQKHVLFACRLPPPYTGETLGSQLTFDLLKNELQSECFRLNRNCAVGMAGKFSFSGTFQTFNRLFNLTSLMKKNMYDVLYIVPTSSTLGHMRDILLIALVRSRVPFIIAHVHSGNFQEVLQRRFLRFLSRYFVDQVDQFIFLSEHLASRAAGIIPDEKRTVIHNPIDDGVKFTQEECLEKVSQRSAENSFNILFISNMIESKGYWDLAEALTMLSSHIKWYAHFIGDWGDESQKNDFETYLSNRGISDRTTVYGKISDRSEIKEMYRKADVFILPTYYPVEAQPRSIIEAMNAATPVIATRHASIPEYVEHDSNGYLVSKQIPYEIAEAIENLADREKWREFAMAARNTYLKLFSTEVIKGQLLNLFTQELHSRIYNSFHY